MSDASTSDERVGTLLRDDPDAFDALRDTTADRYGVDPGAVEKDYWATEVLRHATRPLGGVGFFVFKGGTSLSKAYGIIERFSEDIDLLVISALSGKPLKRLLRTIAERTSLGLGPDHAREHEGRGYLNARYDPRVLRADVAEFCRTSSSRRGQRTEATDGQRHDPADTFEHVALS